MGKEKFDENKPMHKHARWIQEKLIKFSDIDHKTISNERAKYVLGRFLRLEPWLQIADLNSLEDLGLIKRNKRIIYILSVDN